MLYVAELTINHIGSTNIIKAMITEAKKSGADFVKFKFKDVESYYPNDGKKWRNLNFKEYRNSLEINRDDVWDIVNHCNSVGIKWFTTIHDQASLDFIKPYQPCALKIASMDAAKKELFDLTIDACKEMSVPLVYSMGGKTHEFYRAALSKIEESGVDAYILHCVSIYPTPDGMSNCGYVSKMRSELSSDRVSVGYSGHEVGYAASVVAALNGATMIERHFTLSRDLKIHHLECALLPEEFRDMVDFISRVKMENASDSETSSDESKFLEGLDYGGE